MHNRPIVDKLSPLVQFTMMLQPFIWGVHTNGQDFYTESNKVYTVSMIVGPIFILIYRIKKTFASKLFQ